MKNENSYRLLKSIIAANNLPVKGAIKTGWGIMALSNTPNAKFEITYASEVKKAFAPYKESHNIWFRTSAKYITIYIEDLDLERFAYMTIANGNTLKVA